MVSAGPRFFSPALALAWTLLLTSGLWLVIGVLFAVFGRRADDIALLGFAQVAVYGLGIAAFGYALPLPVRDLLALRRVPIVLCVAAALLGAALQVPASLLATAVEHFFPSPPELLAERVARVTPHSVSHAITILLVVAGLGPWVEELFFRGALYGALRKSDGAWSTAAITSSCFALGHLEWRLFLPLLLAAVVIARVREFSGSVWPCFAAHAAFNAATLQAVFAGLVPRGQAPTIPLPIALFGSALTLVLFATVRRLALANRTR